MLTSYIFETGASKVVSSGILIKLSLLFMEVGIDNCLWKSPRYLSLLGKEVIPAHVVKDLGVTFDSRLTFSHVHIVKTVSFCFLSLAQINRVKHVFNRSTLTTTINTLCFN